MQITLPSDHIILAGAGKGKAGFIHNLFGSFGCPAVWICKTINLSAQQFLQILLAQNDLLPLPFQRKKRQERMVLCVRAEVDEPALGKL